MFAKHKLLRHRTNIDACLTSVADLESAFLNTHARYNGLSLATYIVFDGYALENWKEGMYQISMEIKQTLEMESYQECLNFYRVFVRT